MPRGFRRFTAIERDLRACREGVCGARPYLPLCPLLPGERDSSEEASSSGIIRCWQREEGGGGGSERCIVTLIQFRVESIVVCSSKSLSCRDTSIVFFLLFFCCRFSGKFRSFFVSVDNIEDVSMVLCVSTLITETMLLCVANGQLGD